MLKKYKLDGKKTAVELNGQIINRNRHKLVYIKNNDRLCKRPLPHVTEKGKGFDIDTEEDLIFYKKNFFRPKVKSFYK